MGLLKTIATGGLGKIADKIGGGIKKAAEFKKAGGVGGAIGRKLKSSPESKKPKPSMSSSMSGYKKYYSDEED